MPEIKTPICDLLSIKVPIIQAPVGNATTPALAAAVSNAGALGMLSLTWRSKRYSDAFAGLDVEGDVEGLPLYAGQSAGFVDEIEPAGKIVQKIVDELERTVEP